MSDSSNIGQSNEKVGKIYVMKPKLRFWGVAVFLIVSVHLFLLSKLNFFPYPELFVYSYLTEKGLVPYKQIFDQHFPGVMFFPVNLASLGIDTPEEMRILHLSLIAITHVLLFVTSRKLFKSRMTTLFSNFLYIIWQPFFEGNVLWIETFVTPFLLASFYFLVRSQKNLMRSYFLSGFFLGLALLFKQVIGPLIILVAFYLFVKKKHQAVLSFCLGVLIPVAVLILWISYYGIWKEFIYWTVTFNLTTFAKMGKKYADLKGILKLIPLFGIAISASFYTAVKKRTNRPILVAIFLFGSLLFAYARFDYIHFQPALPFAILAFIYGFREIAIDKRFFMAPFYGILALYLILPFWKSNIGRDVLFFGEQEQKLSKQILSYANEGDTVFAMATTPHIYELTKTLPPGKVFVFQFPWFMKIAEQRVLAGIIIDPPKVVIRDLTSQVQEMNLVFYMPEINDHIERYYQTVYQVDGIEVLVMR